MKVVQVVSLWLLITSFGILNTSSNHLNFAKSQKDKINRLPANQSVKVIKVEKEEEKK